MGFVIANKFMKYVNDIEPISDRLCMLTLSHTTQIRIFSVYAPQAERPTREKEQLYKQLTENYKKHKNKGPTYVLGDFNARIQCDEEDAVGRQTVHAQSADPLGKSDQVIKTDHCV